jgi:hypothetical protein
VITPNPQTPDNHPSIPSKDTTPIDTNPSLHVGPNGLEINCSQLFKKNSFLNAVEPTEQSTAAFELDSPGLVDTQPDFDPFKQSRIEPQDRTISFGSFDEDSQLIHSQPPNDHIEIQGLEQVEDEFKNLAKIGLLLEY